MHYEQVFDLLTEEYSIVLATTDEDFEAVKQIREEVFSSKYNMSSEKLRSIGFIYTQDDQQAFIYLIKHIKTKTYVGTVRAFFVNGRTPVKKLPMQKNGKVHDIDHLTNEFPIVEISRGALIQKLPTHEKYSALKVRSMLTYGLMVSTRINFYLYNYLKVFTFIESTLHIIFQRQNVIFEQVGKPIISHGTPRISYVTTSQKLFNDTEENMGKITKYYLKKLCKHPEPFWKFIDNNPYLKRSDIQLDKICELFETYGDDADLTLLFDAKKSTSQPTMA